MTRLLGALALTTLLSCVPASLPPTKTWTTADFIAGAKANKTFAGIAANTVAVSHGATIPWRSAAFDPSGADVVQAGDDALAVWPAFAGGNTAAFLLTDLWDEHPTPWVQPVYLLVSHYDPQAPKRVPDVRSVFPVDVTATFSSPFWRAMFVTVPETTTDTDFTSATALLDSKGAMNAGPTVFCPIVPKGTGVARAEAESVPRRPLSLEPTSLPTDTKAWVDGKPVWYFNFSVDRFVADDSELPIEKPVYFFVTQASDNHALLPLPPVLPNNPKRWSLGRRYDVELTPDLAVFVPATNAALRTAITAAGASAPEPAADIPTDVARRYTLRVATSASCFHDATTFPQGCTWLDSAAAVEAAFATRLHRTETLLSVGALDVKAP